MGLFELAILVSTFAAAANPSNQESAPVNIAKFLERCETSRRGAIVNTEHELRGLRRQSPPTAESTRRIAELEERLELLKTNCAAAGPATLIPPTGGRHRAFA